MTSLTTATSAFSLGTPEQLTAALTRAKHDSAFISLDERFSEAGIMNWLLDQEKCLLFSIGAYSRREIKIVEIGSFQGGSASYLAGGLKAAGMGKLYCVDPHLGGPPWLGMAPHQQTFSIFREKVAFMGVADHIQICRGESTAVAAVWPAERIDAVFIDGDHSFRGALKDFEAWAPKLRQGGLILVDDADDPVLTELLDFIEFLKELSSIRHVATIQGMAVFTMGTEDQWAMLAEFQGACSRRGLLRPWDYSPFEGQQLPPNYDRTKSYGSDHGLTIAYQLVFLARCGRGDYGYTEKSQPEDREFLQTLSRDRKDGRVRLLDSSAHNHPHLRCVLCEPEEAEKFAPLLMPGGVLIARENGLNSIETRNILLKAGLEGCGYDSGIQWGVWQPANLSPEAIMEYAGAAYRG